MLGGLPVRDPGCLSSGHAYQARLVSSSFVSHQQSPTSPQFVIVERRDATPKQAEITPFHVIDQPCDLGLAGRCSRHVWVSHRRVQATAVGPIRDTWFPGRR